MEQTVPFTWTAFVERMLDDHQYAFAEHPWQSFPHPVLPFVTRVRGIVYVSSRQNLLLADPRIHALGQRRLTELSDSELTRMKTQRENPPEAPLGWARVRKSVMLYVRNRIAIPGGIAAHILGRHDRTNYCGTRKTLGPRSAPTRSLSTTPTSSGLRWRTSCPPVPKRFRPGRHWRQRDPTRAGRLFRAPPNIPDPPHVRPKTRRRRCVPSKSSSARFSEAASPR